MTETLCVTNNPNVRDTADAISVSFVSGSPHDVFVAARDRIHQGWKLAIHPLYGNFRPRRQPYRTLLLHDTGRTVDRESLELIESAFAAWRADAGGRHALDENALKEYARLDLALLEESLRTLKA